MTRKHPDEIESMAELRICIDAVDAELMDLLAERWSYTEKAAGLKAREGLSAAAPGRRAAVLDKVRAAAIERGMDGDMVARMWDVMIETVIAREEHVIGKDGRDG